MATTINRSGITLTNDTGTPSVPVGDGTLLSAADRAALLDAIDAVLSGAVTVGGVLSAEGFGTHAFSSGGTGGNILNVRNTTAGTGNHGAVYVGNDASATGLVLQQLSSTFTGANNLAQIVAQLSGGLRVITTHATGPLELGTNSTVRAAIDGSGVWTFTGSSITALPLGNGSAGSPSLTFASDTDTGLYRVASDDVGLSLGGVLSFEFGKISGAQGRSLDIASGAWGTGAVQGNRIQIGRNSSGNGASGSLGMANRPGTTYFLWPDASANLRIDVIPPTEDNSASDTGGTVVGTQTSTRVTKQAIRPFEEPASALALLARTPLYRFRYRQFDPETEHVGIMADESPEFTRFGRTVFDPVNAFGYTAAAIKALLDRVETLESALAAGGQAHA